MALPPNDPTNAEKVGKIWARMPRGLIDALASAQQVYPPPRPRTLRGWLVALRDTFVVEVLRRCNREGCWERGTSPTMLSGRLCARHWEEYYFDEHTA